MAGKTRKLPIAQVRMARLCGADIRISVRGEGRPLLLVMGIGASLDMWEPFEREMAPKGYQLISFDLPGTGASPAVFPPRRMPGLARIALAVLNELNIHHAYVMGVSLGGAVAQEIAHLAPRRVTRLVLAATMPGIGGLPGNPLVTRHMLSPRRYHQPDHAMKIAGSIYGGKARTDPTAQGATSLRFRRPPSTYGYVSQLFAVWGWSSMPYLWRIKVPTLVLSGDDDPIIPLVNGRVMSLALRDSEFRVLEGAGHLFLLDDPADSAEIVDGFLSKSEVEAA